MENANHCTEIFKPIELREAAAVRTSRTARQSPAHQTNVNPHKVPLENTGIRQHRMAVHAATKAAPVSQSAANCNPGTGANT